MCQIEYIFKECILCFSVLFPPPPTTLSAAAGFPPPPSGLPRLTPPIGPPAVNGHAVKEPPRWSDWEIQKVIKDQDWLYMDQVIWWWRKRKWRSRISKHKRISAGLDIQEISEERRGLQTSLVNPPHTPWIWVAATMSSFTNPHLSISETDKHSPIHSKIEGSLF